MQKKNEYLENEKSFLDEIKNICHSFWRAIIRWKKTGTILPVLSLNGKEPEEKERWNKSASCLEISYFRRIKILFGILKGPLALLMLREDMM